MVLLTLKNCRPCEAKTEAFTLPTFVLYARAAQKSLMSPVSSPSALFMSVREGAQSWRRSGLVTVAPRLLPG